jgi:hypothetical protein
VTELILESLDSSATLSDSFIILYAAFVGALYRVIGVEFGKCIECYFSPVLILLLSGTLCHGTSQFLLGTVQKTLDEHRKSGGHKQRMLKPPRANVGTVHLSGHIMCNRL